MLGVMVLSFLIQLSTMGFGLTAYNTCSYLHKYVVPEGDRILGSIGNEIDAAINVHIASL